jgi:ABC-type lipoprotein export system ATPase subunit
MSTLQSGHSPALNVDESLVRAEEVWKTYDVGEVRVPAVCGVSLSIPRGQFLIIMGSSGSGKSTLLHLLGCLDRPDAGRYWLVGQDVTRLTPRELAGVRNRTIGYVFQSFNLLARTSVLDNVALPLAYQKVSRRERRRRASRMLDRVGLTDRASHLPNQLSGGQQQRVAIARALITSPSLLLADEPTGNLDSHTGDEIMRLLAELNRDSALTIALVTHEPAIALYGDRLVTLRDGRLASDAATPHREPAASGAPKPAAGTR